MSEAKKRANKKYDHTHLQYFNLTMKKEFAACFAEFFNSEAGKQYQSKSAFIVKAMREKMEADGYHFDEEKE